MVLTMIFKPCVRTCIYHRTNYDILSGLKRKNMRYQMGIAQPTSGVTTLLIITIATYLLFALGGDTRLGTMAYAKLILDPASVVYSFEYWRLASYAFLHDTSSPMHIIFNALMLYMLGTPLEERWGEKRFLIFVGSAILTGGLVVTLSYVVGLSNSFVVGISAATIGLAIAWGLTFSTSQIYILGIIPVTGKQLVWLIVGIEIIYAVSTNAISSAAHIGGIITGFIFCLGLYKPRRIKQILRWRP